MFRRTLHDGVARAVASEVPTSQRLTPRHSTHVGSHDRSCNIQGSQLHSKGVAAVGFLSHFCVDNCRMMPGCEGE